MESGVTLSFVETTPEDCDGGGNCSFGVAMDRVWLFPARLNADLSGLPGAVTQAEMDVVDGCGLGCTQAFLYEGIAAVDSASNTMGVLETLSLSSGGASVDRLAVSSCEGAVVEIRLTMDAGLCGDGRIQWRHGETCEPPNTTINRGWYCDENCQSRPVRCGDGMVMGWEQCEFDRDCENFPIEICEECHCVPNPGFCGDGMVQWNFGENCEPGVGNECGPGRFCDPELCICREKTDGLEACCTRFGGCLETTPAECRGISGTPQGPGTNCTPDLCPHTLLRKAPDDVLMRWTKDQ
jgi:hypothetical protein